MMIMSGDERKILKITHHSISDWEERVITRAFDKQVVQSEEEE